MEPHSPSGREKYQLVLAMAHRQPAIVTAVVHPCDETSLSGAVEAHRLGLISAILVAPEARLRALAKQHAIDISGLQVVASDHSHDSAARAVALVRAGKAEALMKGSLHTDEVWRPWSRATPVFAQAGGSAIATSWTCRATPRR